MTIEETAPVAAADQVSLRIQQVLKRRRHGPMFADELRHRLGAEVTKADFDQGLNRLADGGQIMVRKFACPDPHLSAVDLRIIAWIPEDGVGTDAVQEAIEAEWDRWLAAFLASHRCC